MISSNKGPMVWKYLFGNDEQEDSTAVKLKNPSRGEVKGAATSVLDGLITPVQTDLEEVPRPPKKDAALSATSAEDDSAKDEGSKKEENPMKKNFWDEATIAPTLNTDLIASREKEVTPPDLRKGESMDFSSVPKPVDVKDMDKEKEEKDDEPMAMSADDAKPAASKDQETPANSAQITDIKGKIDARKDEEQKALTKLEEDLKKIQDQISSRKAAITELDQLQPKIVEAEKKLADIEAEQARIKREQEDAAHTLAELQKKVGGNNSSF